MCWTTAFNGSESSKEWGTQGNTTARVNIISIDYIRIKTNYVQK